jgi:hypothetical protein
VRCLAPLTGDVYALPQLANTSRPASSAAQNKANYSTRSQESAPHFLLAEMDNGQGWSHLAASSALLEAFPG